MTFLLKYTIAYTAASLFILWKIWRCKLNLAFTLVFSACIVLLCLWRPIMLYFRFPEGLYHIIQTGHNLWLGICIVSLVIFALLWILKLLFRLLALFRSTPYPEMSPRQELLSAMIMLVIICIYSYQEAHNVKPVYFTIYTSKLPPGQQKLRLVYVTDVHLNEYIGFDQLKKVTDCIMKQKPDILLTGGDVVDASMYERDNEARLLQEIRPAFGSFGILGNHEGMHDYRNNVLPFMKKARITPLRGEMVQAGGIIIAGEDDPLIFMLDGQVRRINLQQLKTASEKNFVVLLRHRPLIRNEHIGYADLQLSGHSHGGQLWPGKYIMQYIFGTPQGEMTAYKAKGKTTWFYTSVGTGYWRIPMRFMTPPEVVVIDLVARN